MDKRIYKPRIIDRQVEEYLSAFGAVCIEGPKWCGKTWTSSYHSKSEIYIGDPAGNFQNCQLAEWLAGKSGPEFRAGCATSNPIPGRCHR